MTEHLNPIPSFIVKDYSAQSKKTLEVSLERFSKSDEVSRRILSAFCAFREARQVYPVTEDNFLSGERVPIIEAEETNETLLFQLFSGMYKISFQLLREVLELTLLQFYLYLQQDTQFLNDWIKARKGTPSKKNLKSVLKTSNLYVSANKSIKLDSQLDSLYESLSRYTHTQGFVHSHQGLKTANRPVFSEIALRGFSEVYIATIKYCVFLIAIHFPNAIIGFPVYQKFGYGGPICFIDQDHTEMVRAIFSESELLVLEDLASQNTDFQELRSKVESMPDLSKEQIDETWEEIEGHMNPSLNNNFME
ncbi:hypothetical protein ACFLTR_00195 [Chloroflexota bacterium]